MLVDALVAAGIILQRSIAIIQRRNLQDFVRNNGADLFEDKKLVVPGWEGQPKGLMQVLRERGLIDTLLIAQFTVEGNGP